MTTSENEKVAEIKAHARVPQAIVIALVTALSTGAVTMATRATPAETNADVAGLKQDVREMRRDVNTLVDTVNKLAQDSANRDTVQDAKIENLRGGR